MLTKVRSQILEQFYRASFGQSTPPASAYQGVSAEEYVALEQIRFPKGSPKALLARSPAALGLRDAAKNAPDPAPSTQPPLWEPVKAASVELSDLAFKDERLMISDAHIELSGNPNLKALWLIRCSIDTLSKNSTVNEGVKEVIVDDCDVNMLQSLSCLLGSSSEYLSIWSDRTIVDLGALTISQHVARNLRKLRLRSPLIQKVDSLSSFLSLDEAFVIQVSSPETLVEALAASKASLNTLVLSGLQPMDPDSLQSLETLSRFTYVVRPDEDKESWIRYAVEHPNIAFSFEPTGFYSETYFQSLDIAEIYKGISIYKIKRGRANFYRIEDDFIEHLNLAVEDHEELEDLVKNRLKKVKVDWGSEIDTFVAESKSISTIKQIILEILSLRI